MKNLILFMIVCLISGISNAQDPADPKSEVYLKQTGKMFTVKIVPGDKESSFYIFGKKAAKLKLDKLNIEASLFVGDKEQKLTLKQQEDRFVTSEPLKGDSLKIKLNNDPHQKTEEIRIKLKP